MSLNFYQVLILLSIVLFCSGHWIGGLACIAVGILAEWLG